MASDLYYFVCLMLNDLFIWNKSLSFSHEVMQLFNHSHQVLKPINQVIALVDPDANHLTEGQNLNSDEQNRSYSVEEFEVRIMEPEKSGGPWQTKATIPMQSSENALTVRMVTLMVILFPLVFKAS